MRKLPVRRRFDGMPDGVDDVVAMLDGKLAFNSIDPAGIDALRAKLTLTSTRRDRTVSLLYPLAVGNLLTACMNLAAEIGVPTVTADVVKGV